MVTSYDQFDARTTFMYDFEPSQTAYDHLMLVGRKSMINFFMVTCQHTFILVFVADDGELVVLYIFYPILLYLLVATSFGSL
jgi:hypothetical protein